MKIGFDVDGVLANFNTRFIERTIAITGRDLFPPRPFEILYWDYPQFYGYTPLDMATVWNTIRADAGFWLGLDAYSEAPGVLDQLRARSTQDDVYFITSRPGVRAKQQTEVWLATHSGDFLWNPTVLISNEKMICARAVELDAYIDDNWDNVVTTAEYNPKCQVFLLDRPWNRDLTHPSVWRIREAGDMLPLIDRAAALRCQTAA